MRQHLDIKTGTPKTLRKVMIPVGIVTAVLGFVYLFLFTGAIATTGEEIQEAQSKMLDAARYMAIVFGFLTLVLAGLAITHSVFQLMRINKTNLKWELISGLINAIVGLLLFIFFIIVIANVFKDEKWYGEDIYKHTSFMGILTALSVYTFIFSMVFNQTKLENKNTNIKMLKTIGLFTLVLSLCNLIPTILTLVGGFVDIEKVEEAQKAANWEAASFAAKFAIAAFGVMAIGVLFMIPLAIFGINDKQSAKQNIIMWSVVGGIIFILFVIAAAMMTLDYGAPKKWYEAKNTTITVFVLLAEIASIAGGALAFAKTKQSAPAQIPA